MHAAGERGTHCSRESGMVRAAGRGVHAAHVSRGGCAPQERGVHAAHVSRGGCMPQGEGYTLLT